MKEKVLVEYGLLVEQEKEKPRPNYNGIQNKIARKFDTTPSYVSRCLSAYRNQGQSNPTITIQKYAERLKEQCTQLEIQQGLIQESNDRVKRLQDLAEDVEQFLNETKKVLSELELKIDAFDPQDLATGDDNIPIIRRLLSSKRSPLMLLSAIDTLRNLIGEERKEALMVNSVITTINSARKTVLAINNMFYGGDPTNWDQKTKMKVQKFQIENVCPHCPGYPLLMAQMENTIDVDGEELDDEDVEDDDS